MAFLSRLREANRRRNAEYRAKTGGKPLPLLFRTTEFAGEVGELLNVVKKLERERLGWSGKNADRAMLAGEFGGVFATFDLLADDLDIDLEQATIQEFNAVTVRLGLRTMIAPESDGTHPDDLAVDRFAAAMKAKLAAKRAEGRGGWDDRTACPNETLTALLRNHVEKGDPIDVGNLAMMIHQRGEAIGPGSVSDPEPFVAYYRNWYGEVERRWLVPIRVWFGRTDWHPEPQWLLTAWDCNRKAERDFALADFHPGAHDGRMLGNEAS